MNIWVTAREGSVVTLNDGTVVDLDSFPGNGWTANRCANITENIQENWLDDVTDRDALPAGDPDKGEGLTDAQSIAQLTAIYGGQFVELNTKGGSNEFRVRTTAIRVFPVDANNAEVTNGVSFNFTLSEVRR